jgi:hypothetical protein
MSPFEAFGIDRLSPSQLSKWASDRGLWYASARRKIYEDAGPAAWRGSAVEAGLHASFIRPNSDPLEVAHSEYELKATEWSDKHEGIVHDDYDAERAKIETALKRSIEAWKIEGLSTPIAYQVDARGFLPGTPVEVIGHPDFFLVAPAPHCVDLKTANSLPQEAKPDHAIAASIYATLRGEGEAKILYISTAGNPKVAHRLITLDVVTIAYYARAASDLVRQIERTLTAALAMASYEIVEPEAALAELCAPNRLAQGGGLFPLWKPEYEREAFAAIKEWS